MTYEIVWIFFLITLYKGINERKKISMYENLLLKNPFFGKNLKYLNDVKSTVLILFFDKIFL